MHVYFIVNPCFSHFASLRAFYGNIYFQSWFGLKAHVSLSLSFRENKLNTFDASVQFDSKRFSLSLAVCLFVCLCARPSVCVSVRLSVFLALYCRFVYCSITHIVLLYIGLALVVSPSQLSNDREK